MALKIKAIDDPAFATYGRALSLKTQDFLTVMDSRSIAPSATVVYDPSLKELESLALFDILQKQIYGGLPIEFGHCSGWNSSLNALEYHRSSEIDIAATDLVLMLGREQDIDRQNMTYDTANVECFLIPREQQWKSTLQRCIMRPAALVVGSFVWASCCQKERI